MQDRERSAGKVLANRDTRRLKADIATLWTSPLWRGRLMPRSELRSWQQRRRRREWPLGAAARATTTRKQLQLGSPRSIGLRDSRNQTPGEQARRLRHLGKRI